MKTKLFGAALILSFVPLVSAADITNSVAEEKCFPVEGLTEFYDKFDKLKPKRLDTLEAVMSAEFIRENQAVDVPKLWARTAGQDRPFLVDAEGRLTDFHAVVITLPQDAQICGEVKTPEGEIGLSIDSDIVFKNRTGPYSLAELQDGVGDGKSFYKKMFGGAMALFVPKMTHVTIQYINEDTPLDMTFTQGGSPIASPPTEIFGGAHFIALEDIEASGADMMAIGGGEFKLMPSPSVKKMKSLGFTEGDEDEEKDD